MFNLGNLVGGALGAIQRKLQSVFQPKPQPQIQPLTTKPTQQNINKVIQGLPNLGPSNVSVGSAQLKSTPTPASSSGSMGGMGQRSVPSYVPPANIPSYSPSSSFTPSYTPTPSNDMGAFTRKLQQQALKAGKFLSSAGSQIGGIFKNPVRSAYASPTEQVIPEDKEKKQGTDGILEAIARKGRMLAGMIPEGLGTLLNLKERGWSEGIAGDRTPFTGLTPESRAAGFRTAFEEKKLPAILAGKYRKPELSLEETGGGEGGVFDFNSIGKLFGNDLIGTLMKDSITSSVESGELPTFDEEARLKQLFDEAGVPEQQKLVASYQKEQIKLLDMIEAVETDINQSAGNTLMTDAQRRRLIAAKSEPLRKQLVQMIKAGQLAGVGLQQSLSMVSQRMSAAKGAYASKVAAIKAQGEAKQQKFKNLTELLPYMVQKAGTKGQGKTGGGLLSPSKRSPGFQSAINKAQYAIDASDAPFETYQAIVNARPDLEGYIKPKYYQ